MSSATTYTAANVPTVSSLGTPTGSTAGGTSVVITGNYFTGATGVYFGGVAATSFTVNSATSITATTPAQYAGTVDVTVATWAGTSALATGDRFAYTLASLPMVSSLGTSSGTTGGGTSVTINGSNFTSAIAVTFGGVPAASFTVNSANLITAVSPPQAAGTVDVKVTTNAGTSATAGGDQFTVTAALPTVNSLSSSGGSTAGGTSVTITGTHFTGATGVSFGSVAVPFTVNSDSSISVVSPPEPQGTVDVTVMTFAGTSATGTSDQFTYTNGANPTVSAVTATSGSTVGGDVVTISGTNFTGATGVTFDNVAAAGFTVVSDTAIVAISPAHATTGTIDVQVTTYANTSVISAADHYTYNAPSAPTITSLDPSTSGTGGGTVVTITGTNLLNTTGVSFGGTPAASFYVVSDTVVSAVAPPLAAGTFDVTVTTPAGTSALGSADRFVYTPAPAPAVTSLSPNNGSTAGGTSVVITGTNFTGASSVTFGGVAAAFVINSDTSITATSPAEVSGAVDVIVTTPTGTSATSSSDQFTYNPASQPTVTSLSLTSGSPAGGDVIDIIGSYFTGVTGVQFGTVAAAFTFHTDSWITATVPPQAQGTVDVRVTTTRDISATGSGDQYTYANPTAPTVTGVFPSSGPDAGGATVTVIGSHFTGASAVKFNTTAASSFTVLSDTALTVTAPAGTLTVDITVTTPSGTSSTSSADHYTYNATSAPTVSGRDTPSGSAGTVVVVTGTNFSTASAVKFGNYTATFVIDSDTQITAVAPVQPSGTVDITVTNYATTSGTSSSDQFMYNSASPTVTGVSLNSGPTAGGTNVTVTGTGFTGATAVQFGSVAATSFTVVSPTTIFAVAPAESAGTVDVKVTTPVSTSGTGTADHFTFVADQALTTVSNPSIHATSGVQWSGTVASFSDADAGGTASQFTAITSWGDGTYSVSTVALAGSVFNITDAHTYTALGNYTVVVDVWDVGGSTLEMTGSATVTSGFAPIRPGPKATGTHATATHRVAFHGSVASFVGSIVGGTARSYTASITWGDGHTTSGTIQPTGNNNFSVIGANTYATAGTFTVHVTITDSNGASTTVTTTILVADARQLRDEEDDAPSIMDDPWRPVLGTLVSYVDPNMAETYGSDELTPDATTQTYPADDDIGQPYEDPAIDLSANDALFTALAEQVPVPQFDYDAESGVFDTDDGDA
jgi:hypothetical protein